MLRRKKPIILILIILLIIGAGSGFLWFKFKPRPEISAPVIVETVSKYDDFHLEIAKLSLTSPIIPDVPGDNKEAYNKALEGGVAHFAGTKKPGQNGLIFIFAHSSFYPWAAGNYKDIFLHLDELNEGDEISVWYEKKEYKYKVTENKIVTPDDVSILKPTSEETLVLMTCWPPGTTQKRLAVFAKPI